MDIIKNVKNMKELSYTISDKGLSYANIEIIPEDSFPEDVDSFIINKFNEFKIYLDDPIKNDIITIEKELETYQDELILLQTKINNTQLIISNTKEEVK